MPYRNTRRSRPEAYAHNTTCIVKRSGNTNTRVRPTNEILRADEFMTDVQRVWNIYGSQIHKSFFDKQPY